LLTITQGLVGAVSEYCFGRRDAADGGAAAAVVVEGTGAVGDFVDVLGDGAAEALGDAGAELDVDAGAELPAAGEEPVAAEPMAGASGCTESGVQAARAVSPAPASKSRATARRPGCWPGPAPDEA
jgi:hypothetical protein